MDPEQNCWDMGASILCHSTFHPVCSPAREGIVHDINLSNKFKQSSPKCPNDPYMSPHKHVCGTSLPPASTSSGLPTTADNHFQGPPSFPLFWSTAHILCPWKVRSKQERAYQAKKHGLDAREVAGSGHRCIVKLMMWTMGTPSAWRAARRPPMTCWWR